jgi:hypothetical protein
LVLFFKKELLPFAAQKSVSERNKVVDGTDELNKSRRRTVKHSERAGEGESKHDANHHRT